MHIQIYVLLCLIAETAHTLMPWALTPDIVPLPGEGTFWWINIFFQIFSNANCRLLVPWSSRTTQRPQCPITPFLHNSPPFTRTYLACAIFNVHKYNKAIACTVCLSEIIVEAHSSLCNGWTVWTLPWMGRWNIRHLAARMPNAFSITLLARESQ